jgi:hypothetical protein
LPFKTPWTRANSVSQDMLAESYQKHWSKKWDQNVKSLRVSFTDVPSSSMWPTPICHLDLIGLSKCSPEVSKQPGNCPKNKACNGRECASYFRIILRRTPWGLKTIFCSSQVCPHIAFKTGFRKMI